MKPLPLQHKEEKENFEELIKCIQNDLDGYINSAWSMDNQVDLVVKTVGDIWKLLRDHLEEHNQNRGMRAGK